MDFLRGALKTLAEGIMDEAVSAKVGTRHEERNSGRMTQRSRYRSSVWDAPEWTMHLHVPNLP